MSGADCVRWMLKYYLNNILPLLSCSQRRWIRSCHHETFRKLSHHPGVDQPAKYPPLTLEIKCILHDEIDEHTQDEYCQSSSSMSLTIISIQWLNTRVKRSVRLRHLSLVRNLHHLNNVEQCQLNKIISTIQSHVFESAVNENVNIWGGSDLNISWRTTISINR